MRRDRLSNKMEQNTTLVWMTRFSRKHWGNGKLYMQVANSPNIDLLDLGIFRSIQSFNHATPKNEKELIQAVSTAYESYLWNKINHTWLALQCCFNHIIMHNGDNDYNIEHISNEKLDCSGQLPDVIDVVNNTAQLFNTNNSTNYETDASTNEETIDEATQTQTQTKMNTPPTHAQVG